jgi:hypothetical protein
MKSYQSSRIQEITEALAEEGFETLNTQAEVLGLPRSTTWNILRANHKKSGLSAAIVQRMLKSPHLPGSVRAKVLEYVEEKSAGVYGHNRLQQQRFTARLEAMGINSRRSEVAGRVPRNGTDPEAKRQTSEIRGLRIVSG